jgi:heterodisulfide reductase subunit C
LAKKQLVRSGSLLKKVEELSGENLFACYQCGMCSAGCPLTKEMTLLPNQVIRQLQLDDWSVMDSNAMWICASCLACEVRCPKGVDLARVMEALRQIVLRRTIDQVELGRFSRSGIADLPQIALVANLRKKTG